MGEGGVRALCDDSRDRLVVLLDSGSMLPKTLSWLDDQDLLFVKWGGALCDDSRDWVRCPRLVQREGPQGMGSPGDKSGLHLKGIQHSGRTVHPWEHSHTGTCTCGWSRIQKMYGFFFGKLCKIYIFFQLTILFLFCLVGNAARGNVWVELYLWKELYYHAFLTFHFLKWGFSDEKLRRNPFSGTFNGRLPTFNKNMWYLEGFSKDFRAFWIFFGVFIGFGCFSKGVWCFS